jgi:outer membrane lipoprotein-sorting protein
MNPVSILTNWKKEYTAKFIREEDENNRTLQIIDLKPIKTQSYYKIRIYIDKHKNEFYASSIYEKDNTIYSYYINKFISNAVYEDSFFVLDLSKYPDAEIIDMR